ncbi:MAG TPA: sigma-70 family RNA polymerase sigma factor [Bryobacteraceae bacterium]|jgi:RNA polymerase sigma-70 factor (ECF subfamily)
MAGASLFFAALLPASPKTLARGLRRRDPQLLDGLIEQYQYRLYRYLFSLTGNREMAEDLFQETWIRVLDRGHQYDGRSKFEAWLFSIARHLVIDVSRKRAFESIDSLTVEPAAAEPSSWERVNSREVQAAIEESLGRLPAVYREVLVLRFQEDLALHEIAAIVDAPLATVKSRLYRGLETLRGLLGGME